MEKLKLAAIVSLAAFAVAALGAEESCLGRCEDGFNSKMKCQCDSMCRYYKSCCSDYEPICGSKTRGDTFAFAEDDDEQFNSTSSDATPSHAQEKATPIPAQEEATPSPAQEVGKPSSAQEDQSRSTSVVTQITSDGGVTTKQFSRTTRAPPTTASIAVAPPATTPIPTRAPDPEADPCSGLPFDSFMQLKNGSIFAFRGVYFFELDDRAVLPGYPKLIQDVWGIPGPIDAAFTRINCQGKTYIFKGNKYWRFEDDVLDDDYPRDISVGFEKIPDDIDAAFATPASNHHDKEKVYFFKGDQYYQYEFKHQPTHEECTRMNSVSPSIPFTRYTDLYYHRWEQLYHRMFQGIQGNHGGPRFINKDWVGIRSPVDAAMVGRLYISQKPLLPRPDGPGIGGPWGQEGPWGWRGPQGRGNQQRRQSRSPQWSAVVDWGAEMGRDYAEQYYNREIRRQDQDWDQNRNRNHNQNQNQNRYQNQNQNQDQQQNEYRRQQQQYNSDYDYRYRAPFRPDLHTAVKGQPVQNVYFFKKDQYYRVDLQTKRVDYVTPPYPRSIAKYWLGCPDKPGAEKR